MRGRPRWVYARAFVRSLWILGVVGRERFQYWYLLLWTSTHRPRLFPTAVHLAISGYHYRLVCQGFLPKAEA